MDKLMNILLQRNDSSIEWGFHLALDYTNQMVIDSVKSGTISSHYMSPGDCVLQIAGRSTKAMSLEKARYLIAQSGNAVEVIIRKRPQETSWTSITPSTPTFNPTKFTPVAQQTTWKPSFQITTRNDNQESNVILGSVQQDPSGGFVHTFGTPKKPSTPQTASSNYSNSSPLQNHNSFLPRQDSVNSAPSPRYVQEIIVPSGPGSHQSRSPVRQTSYQSNASQFSPGYQSPQKSNPGVYFQPHNSGYDSRTNGSSGPVYQTVKQTTRQESVPFQSQRHDSPAYNTWNSPSSTQGSSPYETARQNSWSQPAQISSPRQESWCNQLDQQNSYQPSRQDSWSNSTPTVNQTSPSYPSSGQDSWSNPPSRPQSVPYQPPSPSVAPGLFSKQNSTSPSSSESAVRYDPVASSPAARLQRQSSVQYQPSPKPFSPADYSPGEPKNYPESSVPNNNCSPYSYGVPGPFARQQSASGSQPWSQVSVESFPTPPPFSPSSENAGAPWQTPSDLPTPPPPPPPLPSHAPPVESAAPIVAPPPPPPPPPPPMPSSAGMMQDVPAWKKQIQATKDAKAAAGIVQTPGTPGQELPAALANSMKRDKKPFTYLPGGLDLSEIRSPKMQRRIMANQQYAPPPPSQLGQQVLIQPRQQNGNSDPQQVQNQMERLNLGEGPQPNDRMAAADAQRRTSTDGYPGQSRSFRILQMMTGGDDAADSVEPPAPSRKTEEEEMRFTGIRRPDNPIPSRAFHALQKMTQAENAAAQPESRYADESADEVRQEDAPVDIRYKGGYIPGRSFKMLQEMTGMNEDGSGGPVVPSVLQQKRQQRKPNLHLNINQPQSPGPKQFPQPTVPASQQTSEEVNKMYRGGRIPSQSFKILQAMTGESGDSQGEDGTDM